jgi:hypothetical protein
MKFQVPGPQTAVVTSAGVQATAPGDVVIASNLSSLAMDNLFQYVQGFKSIKIYPLNGGAGTIAALDVKWQSLAGHLITQDSLSFNVANAAGAPPPFAWLRVKTYSVGFFATWTGSAGTWEVYGSYDDCPAELCISPVTAPPSGLVTAGANDGSLCRINAAGLAAGASTGALMVPGRNGPAQMCLTVGGGPIVVSLTDAASGGHIASTSFVGTATAANSNPIQFTMPKRAVNCTVVNQDTVARNPFVDLTFAGP